VTLAPEKKEAYNEFRRARRAVWQQEIDKRKMGLGCQWPGCHNIIDIPAQLEFAHLSPEDKEFEIGELMHRSPYIPGNRDLLEAEIAKCRVLCLLHHRLETIQENHAALPRRNK
jgi:hypothetical protein